jgi:hypothetical protein
VGDARSILLSTLNHSNPNLLLSDIDDALVMFFLKAINHVLFLTSRFFCRRLGAVRVMTVNRVSEVFIQEKSPKV